MGGVSYQQLDTGTIKYYNIKIGYGHFACLAFYFLTIPALTTTVKVKFVLLNLNAHALEGYSSRFVCLSVCLIPKMADF